MDSIRHGLSFFTKCSARSALGVVPFPLHSQSDSFMHTMELRTQSFGDRRLLLHIAVPTCVLLYHCLSSTLVTPQHHILVTGGLGYIGELPSRESVFCSAGGL